MVGLQQVSNSTLKLVLSVADRAVDEGDRRFFDRLLFEAYLRGLIRRAGLRGHVWAPKGKTCTRCAQPISANHKEMPFCPGLVEEMQ